jgi:hypothetical protein
LNFYQNSGNSGNKRQIPNVYAGFDHAKQWEQSGNKLGTEWEHFYMMKFTIYSLLLPVIPPFAAVLSPWLPTHFAGIEREGCPLGASHSAAGVVDNFIRMPNLPSAYILGSVYNFCKCMNSLNIPDNVQKIIHNAHFIQRALC